MEMLQNIYHRHSLFWMEEVHRFHKFFVRTIDAEFPFQSVVSILP